MAALIKNRQVTPDPWLRLEPAADGSLPAIPATGDIIVPLALWRERREALLSRDGQLGVWLNSQEDPALLAGDLASFAVVAVNFPTFNDGRGYSTARLLRERYGWQGELRAVGDIFRDHLFFLSSCGFDAFVLRDSEDPQEVLKSFGDFSESYQSSVERPVPLFRRRSAAQDGAES